MKKLVLMVLLILLIWRPFEIISDSDREISNMFETAKNLDGAYAELYAVNVADLYLQNEVRFIKLLGKKSDETVRLVSNRVAYGCSYKDTEHIYNRSNKLLSSKLLTPREKHMVSAIIEQLKLVEKQ